MVLALVLENVLIYFSEHFAQEYSRIAIEVHKQGVAVVAKVDGSRSSLLMRKFQVKAFPTFRFFRQKANKLYDGKRTFADIIEFIHNNARPLVLKFYREMEIREFTQNNDAAVFVYNGEDKLKLFTARSNAYEGIQFATIENDELPTFLLYTREGMFEFLEDEFDNERYYLKFIALDFSSNLSRFFREYSYPFVFTWQKRE